MSFEDLPALLRVKEAALWLGIHPKHLYRIIESGEIPSRKKPIRIRKEEVKAWLDKGINPS